MKSRKGQTSTNVVNVSFTTSAQGWLGHDGNHLMPRAFEPIDFVHLARQSGGDEALEAELLTLFADQCVRQLSRIIDTSQAAMQRRDAAHTLKGAARAIGAWAVADAADEIETALQAGREIGMERMVTAANEARHTISRCARAE